MCDVDAYTRRPSLTLPAPIEPSSSRQPRRSHVPELPRRGAAVDRPVSEKLRLVADADGARLDDVAIEREPSLELLGKSPQDRRVLLERVGGDGRHHAASSDLPDAHDGRSDTHREPDPPPFR